MANNMWVRLWPLNQKSCRIFLQDTGCGFRYTMICLLKGTGDKVAAWNTILYFLPQISQMTTDFSVSICEICGNLSFSLNTSSIPKPPAITHKRNVFTVRAPGWGIDGSLAAK